LRIAFTVAEVARRLGYEAKSVGRALRRSGTKVRRRRPLVTTERDRRLHTTWRSIVSRCTRPRDPLYERYGARGVKVCEEWLEFAAFRDWALASGWKPGLSLGLDVRWEGYAPGKLRLDLPEREHRAGDPRRPARVPVRDHGLRRDEERAGVTVRCRARPPPGGRANQELGNTKEHP
jgi:hypothetical protein